MTRTRTVPHLATPFMECPHGFFGRRGGTSRGVYDSLNCGPGSADIPARIAENRRIAANCLSGGRDTPLLSLYQVHGDRAVTVQKDWAGDRPQADGMVTDRPGLILGILTADCAPVLLHDPAAGVIGAAHAGWKGALTGILEATADAMMSLGATRENIRAAIGPAISQASYEVGRDMHAAVLKCDSQAADHFADGRDEDHFQFDLEGYAARRLKAAGVTRIWCAGIDTYQNGDYFSYRRCTHRGETDYGRQVSAIMIAP